MDYADPEGDVDAVTATFDSENVAEDLSLSSKAAVYTASGLESGNQYTFEVALTDTGAHSVTKTVSFNVAESETRGGSSSGGRSRSSSGSSSSEKASTSTQSDSTSIATSAPTTMVSSREKEPVTTADNPATETSTPTPEIRTTTGSKTYRTASDSLTSSSG